MPTHFAILRVEKVKSFGELRGRGKHNARHTDLGIEHCDPATAPELIAGQDDAAGAWKTLMTKARLDPDGVRKNGTVALEWMATASPEWFAKASPKSRRMGAHQPRFHHQRGQGETHCSLCPFPSRRDHAPPANPDLPPCQKVGEESAGGRQQVRRPRKPKQPQNGACPPRM